jgi:hypothetical protein
MGKSQVGTLLIVVLSRTSLCTPVLHDQLCQGQNMAVCAKPLLFSVVHAAVSAAQPLLAGGADPNAPYRLPDGRSVTPLTWAMPCEAASMNHTEYGYPGLNIETLLSAGAAVQCCSCLSRAWQVAACWTLQRVGELSCSVDTPGHAAGLLCGGGVAHR